jgi:hypothetical protein
MNRSCLKNLLLILMLLGAVCTLNDAASGQVRRVAAPQGTGVSRRSIAVQTDTDAQTVTNSITIRTGVGAAVEMSSPLEVSCERLSTLEKVGQGKPAAVTDNPGAQGGAGGSAASPVGTTGKADYPDASQITIPSHGRTLTLKIAEGHVAVACDDAARPDNMPSSR